MLQNYPRVFLAMSLTLLMWGCGDADRRDEPAPYDNTEEVEAFYRDNADRFVFATPDDLPANLVWENGADLPTFADPAAKRGGRLSLRIRSMQQTLRMVGPDSNGTLRAPLWSANTVNIIESHPWEDGYMPGLAREWALDPVDGQTVYFRLDPDARWSDGRPFTVDDVFFTFYALMSPHIQAPALNRVTDEGLARLVRYDAVTYSYTPAKASPEPLFQAWQIPMMQREFYRELGPDYVDRYHFRFPPVTGPYTLDPEKVQRGRQITFERLQNWWADDKRFYKGRFNPDQLTFVVARDDSKAFEMFVRGDIDWYFLDETALWYERADEAPIRDGYIERAWHYDRLPAPSEGVHMNAMHPPLDNRDVRLGIQHAINFDGVNDSVYRGDKRRIRTFSDGYGRYSHPSLRAREFDLDKAADYFEKAGFVNRGSDGILVNSDGDRLAFSLTISNQTDEVAVATILKSDAKLAGLELNIDSLDPTAFFTKVFEKKHQLTLSAWNTGYSPVPYYLWELNGREAGKPSNFNTTNISDARLDELVIEWDGQSDPERAQVVAHEIQERVHDFAAWVPGLMADYRRLGYWRWVRWPDYFQIPEYFFWLQSGVFWIDIERKSDTLEARAGGRTFESLTLVHDRFKEEVPGE